MDKKPPMSWASELEAGGAFRRQRREDSSDCSARATPLRRRALAPLGAAKPGPTRGWALQFSLCPQLSWRGATSALAGTCQSHPAARDGRPHWHGQHGMVPWLAREPSNQPHRLQERHRPSTFRVLVQRRELATPPPPRRKSFSRRRGTPPASRSQLRLARDWPAVTLQENRPLLFRNHCKLVVRSNASPSSHGVWQHRMSSPRTCPQHHGPATRSGPTQAVTSRQGSTHTTLRPTVSSSVVCRSCGTNLRPAPSGLC